jgi:hypothetical protein
MIKNTFISIIEIVEEINSLEFFYDVGSKIILVDKTNNIKKEITTRIIYDLVIEIEVKENKTIIFDHYLDTNFGNEFTSILDKEITNRGLNFSAKTIKNTIFEDYKHLKFTVNSVAELKEIIAALYTFQILIKHILKNGKIPTPTWNKNHPNYNTWNNYFSIKPITAGIIDGIIDEIISIPTGVFSLYEITYSRKKEKEILDTFFNTEVNIKLIEMYQKEYGIDKITSEYKAGKAFISTGTMLS